MLKIAPTERFSTRVSHYLSARPSYPNQIVAILRADCGLSSASVVADIGSGTGMFTRLLLGNGNRVFAIEPNREMRQAAEQYLARYPNFVSIDGTAESTKLPDGSVDLITSAQAAHWFQVQPATMEFQRILKAQGFLALIWNERRIAGSPFDAEYEELISRHGIDYHQVKQQGKACPGQFFGLDCWIERSLDNFQDLDYPALEQRLLSSSYVPPLEDERCAPMLAELRQLFDRHQQAGHIRMQYDTKLYIGRLETRQRHRTGKSPGSGL